MNSSFLRGVARRLRMLSRSARLRVLAGRAVLAVAALGLMGAGALPASGQYTDLPGDLFLQQNVPQSPNVTGIAVNNPQDMSGGGWVGGSTSNYPVAGNSPVLDGSGTNVWNAGTFYDGGMCNVGITSGVYSADATNFTNVPFGAMDTVRIYAQNYLNSALDNWWVTFPQQVEIGYTTAAFNPGNGYTYNSGALGVLPDPYNPNVYPATAGIATITAVNGDASARPPATMLPMGPGG